ncbi:MAG: PKD domain-containing protein [Myxococcales bacterium]|nr:PKD domain-containing protein [Myxococcales bacterium]
MSHRLICAVVVVVAALTVASRSAEAQSLRVLPVPWVATDPTIPHQAYNGHATTFKAIARGGNGTYVVEWDFDGNGVYDFSATRSNRYDLSTTFTYPSQATTTTFQATVRVTSNAQVVTGTYPVRVFADVPLDPNAASDRQLQVMRSVAVDDALWYLHNQLTRSGNEEDALTGAQATGYISQADNTIRNAATSGFLWSLSLNGHYAAFPPAYIGALPDAADNAARWANDPYAEDAMRVVNGLLLQATIVGVDAASESNLTGFYPEVQQEPIYGTDDGIGIWIGYNAGEQTIYPMGHAVSAFSVAHLGGFVAQVGDANRILGRRFEHVLQQMVDGLVWAQNEAGVVGSWYYFPNNTSDDLSTSLWGMTGLWHADEFARGQGVIVPNLVKARLAQYIQSNSNGCGAGITGGSYTNIGTACDFTLSAGHVLALGWVGANQFDAADTRVAFPSYNGITRGQLRALYNTSLQFINTNFALTSTGQNSWNMGFVEGGNFGRVDGRGNHYGMLHWQDAARAVEPEVVTFGPGNNWARAFSRYLINNQAANGSWNWTFSAALGPNSDNSGGVWLRAVWAILVLSPDAIPPLAIGTSNLATAPEGTVIAFNGAASDPGTGNPVYTWDFDNGDTRPGQNVSYAFPDNGTYDVTLSSTSIGGTSVDTLPITITNVAPTANAGADFTVPEGSAQAFNVAFTDPGTGDTQTFAWAFGDTGSAATQATSHAYADNGVFTVTATVTDDDGGVGTDTVNGTVTNVAPTITSTAPTTATEGQAYSYALTFTDPGTADTHTCTAPVAPAGSALTGCTLDWTPNFAQAIGAAAPVRLCVTDDDGGQTCQNYTIAVNFVDSDGDGLPDSWEISNFGDITSQDQFGDPDADGMNNLQEFTNVTDPNVYDGPNTPTAAAPICGGEIASLQTTLVANNAVDPQGAALIYDFQLYSDVGLTILVAEDATIAQGSGATTSWAVPVNLLENTRYYWRVRAKDQFTYGPYSTPACDFFVNTVNEAPGVPRINTPSFGSQVNALRPDLTVDNATDPDEDVLTYTFEVYRDPALSNLVASQAGVAAGATTTTWTVSTDLMEDHTYYWRVRATDPDALSGDWSSTGQFFVTTMNAVPEPPALVSPQNGTTMANVRPELVILNADDSDLDPLVYDWELATDDTFATIIDSGADVQPQGAVNTAFALAADLTEDTTYCWRARSDDGQATSGYNTACFLVSETNGAPSVPTLNNPSDNMGATTVNPVYSWAPSTDPEDDPITYEVEVKDAAGTVVATVAGVSGTVTSMAGDLQNGGTYTWHARAVDRAGAMSAYSADNTFIVDAPIDDPEVVVNGGGCQTSGPGAGLGLVGLGLLGLLRRRRR